MDQENELAKFEPSVMTRASSFIFMEAIQIQDPTLALAGVIAFGDCNCDGQGAGDDVIVS